MSSVLKMLIDKFTGLWLPPRIEVEGYIIFNNSTNTKSLLLVKDGEKSWKMKWFDDNENIYKTPVVPLNNIFSKKE